MPGAWDLREEQEEEGWEERGEVEEQLQLALLSLLFWAPFGGASLRERFLFK